MIRRALIIYCDNTHSGRLYGPVIDNKNLRSFLLNNIGGDWAPEEVLSIRNPTVLQVRTALKNHFINADYAFVVFSGHGFINTDDGNRQYIELYNDSISIQELYPRALRQTIIIDACRGFYSPIQIELQKAIEGIGDIYHFEGLPSTRYLFEREIMSRPAGVIVLYAASSNQSALDTNGGGAYILSLLKTAENWGNKIDRTRVLPLNVGHEVAIRYMENNFETIQTPVIKPEREIYYPLAVKLR